MATSTKSPLGQASITSFFPLDATSGTVATAKSLGNGNTRTNTSPKPSPTSPPAPPPLRAIMKPPPPPPPPPPKTLTTPLAVQPLTTGTKPIFPPKPTPQTQTPTSHPQATISTILPEHVQPIRRINALLLPIPYQDKFYAALTSPNTSPNFSRAILWTDTPSTTLPHPLPKVIGSIVCRLELDPATQACAIYIQSLTLLSPFRTCGLANSALEAVISYALRQKIEPCAITSLYAHVWTENEDALRWYAARGFMIEGDVVEGYYQRLQPHTARVLRRQITVQDHLKFGGPSPETETPASSMPGHETASMTSETTAKPNPLARPTPSPTCTTHRAASYQTTLRAPTEWNDLPEEMTTSAPAVRTASSGSKVSRHTTQTYLMPLSLPGSRSTSPNDGHVNGNGNGNGGAARGKKKRVYPAAAFGVP